MTKVKPAFTIGDKVLDITFNPPVHGVIEEISETRPNLYFVRMTASAGLLFPIYAHNLRKDNPQ